MNEAIRVLSLVQLIAHDHLVETNNAPGVKRVETLARPGSYVRAAARDIDTGGLDADQHDVVGALHKTLDQAYSFVRCVALKHALIAGQGSVVTRDLHLVRDSAVEFLAHGQAPDGFAHDETPGHGQRLRLQPATHRQIAGPALLLKRPWWRNFGHWLIDSAATLGLATRMRLPPSWQIVVGRQETARMRQVVAETITSLAPDVPVLEHPDDEVWQCDELLYVSPLHVPPLFKHPEGLATLRAMILRGDLAAPQPPRRIFVSRGAHPQRRLENEADLIAFATAQGYEVVDPQNWDLAGQARLFRSARSVVGVKGAALTNLLFCPAGTECLVLSPGDFPDPFFWDLASHAGVSYREMFGRLTNRNSPRSHNPFVIDPTRFAELLPK